MRRFGWTVGMLAIIALAVAGGLAALFSSGRSQARREWKAPERLELRAERGAPDYVPEKRIDFSISGVFEETLPAMERAVARGFGALQLDLRVSRDGQLIVMHDEAVDRTTQGHGRVADLTLAQLQSLDAGNGARILTLDEVFSHFDTRVRYELTLLDGTYFQPAPRLLVKMVRGYPMAAQLVIASPYPWVVGQIEAQAPELKTELILSPEQRGLLWGPSAVDRWLDYYGIDGIQIAPSEVTPARVAALHARGLEVVARDVRTVGELEAVRRAGVDAVSSFFTSLADPASMP